MYIIFIMMVTILIGLKSTSDEHLRRNVSTHPNTTKVQAQMIEIEEFQLKSN